MLPPNDADPSKKTFLNRPKKTKGSAEGPGFPPLRFMQPPLPKDGGACRSRRSSMTCFQAKDCDVPNSLNIYLREIKDGPLLSAAEERELAGAIAEGDSDARSRMIRSNLRLVVKIARDYVGRGMALEDLIGEGNLGLIRASEEFDPGFGTRFSTYASYWIKQAIRHALTNTTATIRLPAHMVGLLTKWRRAERTLWRELGHEPAPEQIADTLGLTPAQRTMVERALRARKLRLDTDRSREMDDAGWASEEAIDGHDSPD